MTLIQLFLVLALNSLACLGIHCLTSEGMVLNKPAEWIHNKLDGVFDFSDFICKPLFDCMPCMASIWGIIGWFYFQPDIHLIPYLLILCGVNTLVSKVYYYGD